MQIVNGNKEIEVRYEIIHTDSKNSGNTKNRFWKFLKKLGMFIIAMLKMLFHNLLTFIRRLDIKGFAKNLAKTLHFLWKWFIIKPLEWLQKLLKRNKIKTVVLASLIIIYLSIRALVVWIVSLFHKGITTISGQLPTKIHTDDGVIRLIEGIIFILLPICALVFVWKMYRKDENSDSLIKIWNWVSIPLFFVFIYWLGAYNFPDWWSRNMATQGMLWLILGIVLCSLMIYKTGGEPFRYILGKVGLVGLILFGIISTIWEPFNGKVTNSAEAKVTSNLGGRPSPFTLYIPPHTVTADEPAIRKFYNESNLSQQDRELMIQHAWDESKFNQHASDGTVFTNVNRNGTVDRGALQINSTHDTALKKLGPTYNVDDLHGNLNASMYVLQTQGHSAWDSSRHGDNSMSTARPVYFDSLDFAPITVSTEEASRPVTITNNIKQIDMTACVLFIMKGREPFQVCPNHPVGIQMTGETIQFKGIEGGEVVSFQFK